MDGYQRSSRSSKSTFGANNELLWFRNYLTKRTQYTNLNRNSPLNYSIEFSSLASFQNTCSFNCHLHYKDLSDKFCCSKYLFYLFQKYIQSNAHFFSCYTVIYLQELEIENSFISRIRLFVRIISLVTLFLKHSCI